MGKDQRGQKPIGVSAVTDHTAIVQPTGATVSSDSAGTSDATDISLLVQAVGQARAHAADNGGNPESALSGGLDGEPYGGIVDRIFINRDKTFWLFQALGWSAYVLMRMANGAIAGQELGGYFKFVLVAAIAGVVLTTVMRHLYRRIRESSMGAALFLAVLISVLMGMVLSAVELFAAPYVLPDEPVYVGISRLANAVFEATTLLAWTAIYFGYHYYESFQLEKERAIKAVSAAHQAQLKMLRYQLNPHFLFNTLNAISTLVLEQASAEANDMLTKLSSFLRYTLVNQPTQKVTVDQEVYTLSLYLDIERVRFQDRLDVEFDVSDDAGQALVPSLILQPLVENAIKYAIAPSEAGGKITVCARLDHDRKRLSMALKDTGPGISDIENIKSQTGSGVGIANTRERLQQIYGNSHRIILENLEPSGLGVIIEIPIEMGQKPGMGGRGIRAPR